MARRSIPTDKASFLRFCLLAGILACVFPVSAVAASRKISAAAGTDVFLPIVMYHYVEDVQNPRDTLRVRLSVPPALLEAQLQELQQRNIKTLFMSQVPVLLAAKGGSGVAVALTFDDGYEDFYVNAFPLLQKYHAHATLYVIVQKIGLHDYLTADQLREMLQSGLVEVGSHTLTHIDLRKVSPRMATREIQSSKEQLGAMFGITVTSFAYPSGKFTQKTVKLVHDAGYSTAVTTVSGTRQYPASSLTLRRVRATRTGAGKDIAVLIGVPKQPSKASEKAIADMSKK